MNIPESLLQRMSAEAEAVPSPATDEQLFELVAKNANGDALDYFRIYNFYADVDMVNLEKADVNLDYMEGICPNCEVWQHGFIAFARDFEGSAYCFNQNDRDPEGNSTIVRLSYTFGSDTSVEKISASAEAIAPNFNEFLSLYLDERLTRCNNKS